MNVYDNDQLMDGGLEEQVLHVTEEDVDLTATMVVVAETIIMDLQFASNTLAVKARSDEDIVESHWLTIWMVLVTSFQDKIKLHTSNNTKLVLLNHIFQLFLLLFPTNSILAQVSYLLCDILHSI